VGILLESETFVTLVMAKVPENFPNLRATRQCLWGAD
jgi:hypothetical protein